jgi:hypothetical protein
MAIFLLFSMFLSCRTQLRTRQHWQVTHRRCQSDSRTCSCLSVGTRGIVLTRVVFTEVDACGTVITRKTQVTATVKTIHAINAHFVVRTTCLNAVINVHLTVSTSKSYRRNQRAHNPKCTAYQHNKMQNVQTRQSQTYTTFAWIRWEWIARMYIKLRQKLQTHKTTSTGLSHLGCYNALLGKQFVEFCTIPLP